MLQCKHVNHPCIPDPSPRLVDPHAATRRRSTALPYPMKRCPTFLMPKERQLRRESQSVLPFRLSHALQQTPIRPFNNTAMLSLISSSALSGVQSHNYSSSYPKPAFHVAIFAPSLSFPLVKALSLPFTFWANFSSH